MSWISNSIDVDNAYNGNRFIIPQEEGGLPFFQNYLSPLFDGNRLFSVPLGGDECQQADVERISHMPLPAFDININTGQEIYQHNLMSSNDSSEMKKNTLNKGSMARRSGKKDRHTKIKTAKGVRDRRMRLSLQIARKFFDLHDRLGFDKASKTIEWLFSKSKKAIDKLGRNASHVTQMDSNSTCRKGTKSLEISEGQMKVNTASDQQGENEVSGTKETQKLGTRSTKHNVKDKREMARARARDRTWEKKMNRSFEESNWSLSEQPYNLPQLGPAGNPNPLFQTGQESMSNTSSQENISTRKSSIHHSLANMGATTSSCGSVSCSMYGYDHEKNGDLFSGGLRSYSNDLFHLGWDISAECLNPNSLDFLQSSAKNFGYFDQNQVD